MGLFHKNLRPNHTRLLSGVYGEELGARMRPEGQPGEVETTASIRSSIDAVPVTSPAKETKISLITRSPPLPSQLTVTRAPASTPNAWSNAERIASDDNVPPMFWEKRFRTFDALTCSASAAARLK